MNGIWFMILEEVAINYSVKVSGICGIWQWIDEEATVMIVTMNAVDELMMMIMVMYY